MEMEGDEVVVRVLVCQNQGCGKSFLFDTTRGGHVPTGCSNYCRNRIKRLAKRARNKARDSGLPTVQEALDWYKDESSGLSEDPNLKAEFYSL